MRYAGTASYGPSYIAREPIFEHSEQLNYFTGAMLELITNLCVAARKAVVENASLMFVAPVFDIRSRFDAETIDGYERFLKTVNAYMATPQGWTDSDYLAPSSAQVDQAVNALVHLLFHRAVPATPMLLPNGTIGASWRDGTTYASIDFEEDGEYPWAATDGASFWSGLWSPGQPLPEKLAAFIPLS